MELKEAQAGNLLIAEPFMPDDNFRSTVIFLCANNEEGSFGFVLNRPLDLKLNQAIQDFPEFNARLYLGGPVQADTLHFLHTRGDILNGGKEVLEGVFWGGDFEQLKFLVDTKQISKEEIKFFLGYSGWEKGQLAAEISEKTWIISNAKADFIFTDEGSQLWRTVLKDMGGKYKLMGNLPEDPSLN